jgi:hypothetical protein
MTTPNSSSMARPGLHAGLHELGMHFYREIFGDHNLVEGIFKR